MPFDFFTWPVNTGLFPMHQSTDLIQHNQGRQPALGTNPTNQQACRQLVGPSRLTMSNLLQQGKKVHLCQAECPQGVGLGWSVWDLCSSRAIGFTSVGQGMNLGQDFIDGVCGPVVNCSRLVLLNYIGDCSKFQCMKQLCTIMPGAGPTWTHS